MKHLMAPKEGSQTLSEKKQQPSISNPTTTQEGHFVVDPEVTKVQTTALNQNFDAPPDVLGENGNFTLRNSANKPIDEISHANSQLRNKTLAEALSTHAPYAEIELKIATHQRNAVPADLPEIGNVAAAGANRFEMRRHTYDNLKQRASNNTTAMQYAKVKTPTMGQGNQKLAV